MLIFHGENVVASRQKLISKIKEFKGEVIRLDGNKINLSALKQALEAKSLFGQSKLVVIENILSRSSGHDKDEMLEYCKHINADNFIIWEGKAIDGRKLTSFRQTKIEKFTIPATIFGLLDSLVPANPKRSLLLLHQSLKSNSPQMVFYMIGWQIKNLIIAADLGEKGLDRMAPWQKAKLIRQAKKFDLTKLLSCYHQLLEIDWQQKTGQLPLSLASQLDLFIASL